MADTLDFKLHLKYGVIMSPRRDVAMDTTKNERITARVTEQVKETLSSAAEIMGSTLNQFLIQSALEKAEKIIEKEKIISLGKKDAKVFFSSLEDPPEPNKKLKKAFVNYKEKVG